MNINDVGDLRSQPERHSSSGTRHSLGRRAAFLKELDDLLITGANCEGRRPGVDGASAEAFQAASVRRTQTFNARRTDPGTGGSALGFITPRRAALLAVSTAAADPHASSSRFISRSISLGNAMNQPSNVDRRSDSHIALSGLTSTSIREEDDEGESPAGGSLSQAISAVVDENLNLSSSASAFVTLSSDVQEDNSAHLEDSGTLIVEEETRPSIRSSYNGRPSRLARVTSLRISEAGENIVVFKAPASLMGSECAAAPHSSLESAVAAALAAVDGPQDDEVEGRHSSRQVSSPATPLNPWAPLPGPGMSEGAAARRIISTSSQLKTVDSLRIRS